MILGIDEVGRGCWAGPLVVGAVVLGGAEIDGLTDSKALTKKRREALYDEIYNKAAGIGLGWVSAREIDRVGLSEALRIATKQAVKAVDTSFHEIILDGTVNFLRETPLADHVTLMKKADLLIPSVSAASIVAKVSRDRYMTTLGPEYEDYGFGSNVGYGTVAHRVAIERHGVCEEHRLSFAPLQKYSLDARVQDAGLATQTTSDSGPATRTIGNLSEDVAAEELVLRGHSIIDRNWKTKYCEIDIVSQKGDVYYFTEVKHRKNDKAGDGIAAITANKLNQMKFAARFYAHTNRLNDKNMRLLAVATTGDIPEVTDIIEID